MHTEADGFFSLTLLTVLTLNGMLVDYYICYFSLKTIYFSEFFSSFQLHRRCSKAVLLDLLECSHSSTPLLFWAGRSVLVPATCSGVVQIWSHVLKTSTMLLNYRFQCRTHIVHTHTHTLCKHVYTCPASLPASIPPARPWLGYLLPLLASSLWLLSLTKLWRVPMATLEWLFLSSSFASSASSWCSSWWVSQHFHICLVPEDDIIIDLPGSLQMQ